MVDINIAYQGELRCEAQHQPSNTIIHTDAPKDNHGKGESFSPTDLLATALGSCMMTLMGIAANVMKIDIAGSKVHVRKEMVQAPMRRVGKLTVAITVPQKLDEDQKQKLIKAAMTCPVHHSLHPDIKIDVDFVWG